MIDQLRKLLAPLQRRIQLMVGRGIVQSTTDSGQRQRVQGTLYANEVKDNLERLQDYGFSSVPLPGSEFVVVFPGGDRTHGIIVKCDDARYRKNGMQPGEVSNYTDEGDYFYFKRGRNLNIRTNQWKLQGANDELMDLLISALLEARDGFDKLSVDTTNTIFGPLQLNNFSYYAARRDALDTLIGKLDAMKAV